MLSKEQKKLRDQLLKKKKDNLAKHQEEYDARNSALSKLLKLKKLSDIQITAASEHNLVSSYIMPTFSEDEFLLVNRGLGEISAKIPEQHVLRQDKKFASTRKSHDALITSFGHLQQQVATCNTVMTALVKSSPALHDYKEAIIKLNVAQNTDKNTRSKLEGIIKKAINENLKIIKSDIAEIKRQQKELVKTEKKLAHAESEYQKLEKAYNKVSKSKKPVQLAVMQQKLAEVRELQKYAHKQRDAIIKAQDDLEQRMVDISLNDPTATTLGKNTDVDKSLREQYQALQAVRITPIQNISPEIVAILQEQAELAGKCINFEPEEDRKVLLIRLYDLGEELKRLNPKKDATQIHRKHLGMLNIMEQLYPSASSTSARSASASNSSDTTQEQTRYVLRDNVNLDFISLTNNATKLKQLAHSPDPVEGTTARANQVFEDNERFIGQNQVKINGYEYDNLAHLRRELEKVKSEVVRRVEKVGGTGQETDRKDKLIYDAAKNPLKYAKKVVSRVDKIEQDTKALHRLLDQYINIKSHRQAQAPETRNTEVTMEREVMWRLRGSIQMQIWLYKDIQQRIADLGEPNQLSKTDLRLYNNLEKTANKLVDNIERDVTQYEAYRAKFNLNNEPAYDLAGRHDSQANSHLLTQMTSKDYVQAAHAARQSGVAPNEEFDDESTQDYRQQSGFNG